MSELAPYLSTSLFEKSVGQIWPSLFACMGHALEED